MKLQPSIYVTINLAFMGLLLNNKKYIYIHIPSQFPLNCLFHKLLRTQISLNSHIHSASFRITKTQKEITFQIEKNMFTNRFAMQFQVDQNLNLNRNQ